MPSNVPIIPTSSLPPSYPSRGTVLEVPLVPVVPLSQQAVVCSQSEGSQGCQAGLSTVSTLVLGLLSSRPEFSFSGACRQLRNNSRRSLRITSSSSSSRPDVKIGESTVLPNSHVQTLDETLLPISGNSFSGLKDSWLQTLKKVGEYNGH